MSIASILEPLGQHLPKTIVKQLGNISQATLSMVGRVTMLGISRWTEKGGSYRTVQRFFNSTIVWCMVQWTLIRLHLLSPDDTILIGGDETVVTKSGKKTYGLDRFFSSLYGKPVRGLAFFCLSLISVNKRSSYPVMMEQVIKEETKKTPKSKKRKKSKSKAKNKNRKRGRPKGSKNKNRRDVELSPELLRIQKMLQSLLAMIGLDLCLIYCVLDGAFGHNKALQMVRRCSLHLISKLRCDAALYFPYEGVQKKYGRRKKYGAKLDYGNIPQKYLKASYVEKNIRTDIYQMEMWSKKIPDLINVVILVKTNLTTQKRAHVVLFSSDLCLAYDKLIDYYRLRFQIEFNFRDAKQYFGLEDFMNIKQLPVHNAVNFSMFMVNLSQILLGSFRDACPSFSINDLKTYFRSHKYVAETLKLLPQTPDAIFIEQIFANIAQLGRINTP